ncbi:hypothetical protein ALC57_11108 [Trachymyrmex cornetzi]|uniref:Uncharacterized protein n=1 Tax=Trachymyrmex cornetzi TaxID=471704 RepID=A0A195DVL1_9HYME|nr:hypothetical protein ALC57_11108 [Trachymyrmex cornetzi]
MTLCLASWKEANDDWLHKSKANIKKGLPQAWITLEHLRTSDSTQVAVSFLFDAIFQQTITPSSPPDKSKRSTLATCFESNLSNISDQPKFLKEFFACALTGVPEVHKRCLDDLQCPKQ